MSRKYKFYDNTTPYFISFAVVNWIDVFIRKEYKDVLLESWQYCINEKGLLVHAWCIMTRDYAGNKGLIDIELLL